MDVTWHHPFTAIVAGPSSCGKSYFVQRLLQNAVEMITPPPERVIWAYSEWQDLYTQLPQVEFIEGLPEAASITTPERKLLIIDDLMGVLDKNITDLFTKRSHHNNLSVILITQNLFDKNREVRTINLNTKMIVFFKSPRDVTQITHLARQMYPGRVKFVQEAFADATSIPFGYLLFDLRQDTPDNLRLRTKIFPQETQVVYVPKK